ncbi:general substrate transporter [Xylariaceae sp. FL0255]|nr:general substrate transporter [Xylariaceae sp. FL0255]
MSSSLSRGGGPLSSIKPKFFTKKREIVLFGSTAIALYGYDQGMMSLVNTNRSYLRTMNISESSPMVGIIVSVYYLGCTVGAVIASWWADKKGRKPSILACLVTTMIGNLIMFIAGMSPVLDRATSTWGGAAMAFMIVGRVVLGLGVGGIDVTIPIYSSELTKDKSRGRALAQEFQMNIFGLLLAFSINIGVTEALGKDNQWAWRIPIVVMQIFPILLISSISHLPESPRWYVAQKREHDAMMSLSALFDELKARETLEELQEAQRSEDDGKDIGYVDMVFPHGSQFHPTMLTVMGQINQALTGYGAVSVYGPQIFELLGFGVRDAQFITLGNYASYFVMMTAAWLTIDRLGRRKLMVWGSIGLSVCFALLTVFGGLSFVAHVSSITAEIMGSVTLFVATAIFGVCWLTTVWLIPTEIYPNGARAQGSSASVIIWGLANFTITLLTPIIFNNLNYWLFLVFAVTNAFAGWWTWKYSPETGGRSFEENQEFFESAREEKTWAVRDVQGGRFLRMPRKAAENEVDRKGRQSETAPLLGSQTGSTSD